MKIEELLKYEAPSIAESVSIGWIQDIIAKYLAWKVKRKLKRYNERLNRERFIKSYLNR